MNWKLTKTLFIFVFILVNIFLVIVYIDKVNKSQVNDSEKVNEVNFQQEEIDVPKDVLNQSVKDTELEQITARSKNFSSYAKDHSSMQTSDSDKTLEGDIDKGIQVSDKNLQDIKEYIAKKIFNGKEYQLSDLTKDKVTYEQTYKDYPIMNNSKARLTFNLSDGKATSYKQTAMDDIQVAKGSNSTKKQVITPRKAIEALYYNRYLKQNDQVLDARLGYYSVVKETNVQLLQPNWEIKVKHKGKDEVQTYYVEATNHNPKVIDY
ncbi:two-component system regulatory protein YycI [Staphylococcus epidermidis]|uniref:two-component system regulatory protein YycI n=1 Tax=Staphylococcus epidermidis TaxID=1282 RepID=UPI0036F1FA09